MLNLGALAICHDGKNVTEDVDFLIWTRKNKDVHDTIKYDQSLPESLEASHFDPKLLTKILIHGYGDTGTTGWVINVKNEYLIKGNP